MPKKPKRQKASHLKRVPSAYMWKTNVSQKINLIIWNSPVMIHIYVNLCTWYVFVLINILQIRESRPKVTLVARMVASVGNYDYIFDWEFQMDGLISIKVSLLWKKNLIFSYHYCLAQLISSSNSKQKIIIHAKLQQKGLLMLKI